MPINPAAPEPPISGRITQSAHNLAYRYRKAVTVGLFGVAYVIGVSLAAVDVRVSLIATFAFIVGAAVRTIVAGSK